ncbi:MAG TPA: hypothetical protein VKU01_32245 [Bryobacteraceae bacterium]|nr:hypothetical protein [Bryobacteraceae bacterium]
MKIIHGLLFVAILVFVAGCQECDSCEPTPLGFSFVTCVGNTPVEVDVTFLGILTFPNPAGNWDCSHNGSLGQPDSQAAVIPFFVPFSSPAGASASNSRPGTAQTTAAPSAPAVSYLPPQVLPLPFMAIRSTSDPAPRNTCDPATSPDLLRVNHPNGLVDRISTCPYATVAHIPVVSRPLQIATTPDGRTALVTSFDNAVNFIDLPSNKVTFTLKTDFTVNPDGVAITPDGTRAYITSFNPDNPVVQVIDIASRTIIASIPVTSYPQGIFMTPDGTQAYVTFPLGGAVYIIDTLTNTVANTLGIQAPVAVAFNSTGSRAYITSNTSGGQVQVLETTRYQIVQTYQVGLGPVDAAVAYGDRYVVVNNHDGNSISVIDTYNDQVKTVATPGTAPLGISFIKQ